MPRRSAPPQVGARTSAARRAQRHRQRTPRLHRYRSIPCMRSERQRLHRDRESAKSLTSQDRNCAGVPRVKPCESFIERTRRFQEDRRRAETSRPSAPPSERTGPSRMSSPEQGEGRGLQPTRGRLSHAGRWATAASTAVPVPHALAFRRKEVTDDQRRRAVRRYASIRHYEVAADDVVSRRSGHQTTTLMRAVGWHTRT